MTTSKHGRYEVQTFDRDTGVEEWIEFEADGKAEAVEMARERDVVVGDVKLVSLVDDRADDPGLIAVDDGQRDFAAFKRDESTALLLAWSSIVFGPFPALAAWCWGAWLQARTDGKVGNPPITVAMFLVFIWALLIILGGFAVLGPIIFATYDEAVYNSI